MEVLIITIFVLGYTAIALEHPLKINKAASALLTGVLCWTAYVLFASNRESVAEELLHHLGSLSGILFFLMGAMTIVELIDAHDGFEVITRRITTSSKRKLLWIVCLLTFFLSAALDNLTTAIVMASMVRKLFVDKKGSDVFRGDDRHCRQCGRRVVTDRRRNHHHAVDRRANYQRKYHHQVDCSQPGLSPGSSFGGVFHHERQGHETSR
jgi:Na+/H+ antiporter NhaB